MSKFRTLQAQWVFEQRPLAVGGTARSVGSYGCRPARATGRGAYLYTYSFNGKYRKEQEVYGIVLALVGNTFLHSVASMRRPWRMAALDNMNL